MLLVQEEQAAVPAGEDGDENEAKAEEKEQDKAE